MANDPKRISDFEEITQLNDFNDSSLTTLLDANATSLETKNRNISFANLYKLLKNKLFPITDANITTGINPNNITQTPITNIGSITVNEYGRVTAISPGGGGGGGGSGVKTFGENITFDSSDNSPQSSFSCGYTGNVVISFNLLWRSLAANDPSTIPPVSVSVTIKSSVKTSGVVATLYCGPYREITPTSRRYVGVFNNTIVLPAVANETAWQYTFTNAKNCTGYIAYINNAQ